MQTIDRAEVLPPITIPLDDPDAAIAVEFLKRLNMDWVEGTTGKRTQEQLPANWSEMARFALKVMAYLCGATIGTPEFMPGVELNPNSAPDKLLPILRQARGSFAQATGAEVSDADES